MSSELVRQNPTSNPTASQTRTRVAATVIAALAVAYAALSVWYFYEDFFKYMQVGSIMMVERSGWMVSVDYPYLWTVLSPWRIVGAILAVSLLAMSASALWSGRARARTLSLLSLWGVALPQVFWYTEFVIDWRGGAHLDTVLLVAAAAVLIPTALLYSGKNTLRDWNPTAGALRLFAMAVALGWLAFAATEFLDHSYQVNSWAAYGGATAAVLLAGLAVRGIYHMRAWALWTGVVAAVALTIVPLMATINGFIPTRGYMDEIYMATTGCDARLALSMFIPVAIVWGLGAPYLHGFVRRLRG